MARLPCKTDRYFTVLCCCACDSVHSPGQPCRDLPRGLQLVGQAINNLSQAINNLAERAQVDPSGSILHVAVCNGSDALAVYDGAAKLLASGTDLVGSKADEQFSSMELIGTDGPRSSTATPKQIAQVGACCKYLST